MSGSRWIFCFVLSTIMMVLFSCRSRKEIQLPVGVTVDKILVLKSQRELIIYSGNKALKTYKIALGKVPVGPKQFEGDNKTPEGMYYIYDKNPQSKYHKNFGVSYPNQG